MIKKIIQSTLIFFACFVVVSFPVIAETRSYLITNGFTEPYPSRTTGLVYFFKNIGMEYKSGTVVLSSNPDGTGYITVGDFLDLTMGYPHQGYLPLYGYSNNCLTFHDFYPPQDITHFFKGYLNNGMHGLLIRLKHWCYRPKTIGPLYIVHTFTPSPTPLPSPTPIPEPTPEPFLDLPWDYESKGMDFVDAATSMSSSFDHEYPLLSGGISEPESSKNTIVTFKSIDQLVKPYSSHDGYDYSYNAKVKFGDPVLAASSGTASYVGSCTACGNMIVIDHGNGYQTRYLHLQKDGLITSNPADHVAVAGGQQIGLVGFTGNVDPPGQNGAHIHFSVFQDKNADGNFEDNIPDGATDPFGWDSDEQDPWELFTFTYGGQQKTGNKSYYLWKHKLSNKKDSLPPEGKVITNYNAVLEFPSGMSEEELNIYFGIVPAGTSDNNLSSVGVGYSVKVKNLLGNAVVNFLKPFKFIIDFSSYDISHIKPETLSIYSSPDGEHWTKEPTRLDMTNKSASTSVNHLTDFALFGERKDTVAPVTELVLDGKKGKNNSFSSEVLLGFQPEDNEGGLGVDYTAYTIETPDGILEWDRFEEPVTFSKEGRYVVKYFSIDLDGNTEEVKTTSFSIDTTPPEAEISYDLNILDLIVTGHDGTDSADVQIIPDEKNTEHIVISDEAGNTVTLFVKNREKGKKAEMNIYRIQYNSETPIDLGDTKLSVKALSGKDNILKSLNQLYLSKDGNTVTLDYSEKSNRTDIRSKDAEKEKQAESKEGIVILTLSTIKGLIHVTY